MKFCVKCDQPESCCWCGEEAELITEEEYEANKEQLKDEHGWG